MNEEIKLVITDMTTLETSGVRDIKSFSETELVAELSQNTLYIGGSDLKVERMSVETGELVVHGSIASVYFSSDHSAGSRKGFFSRVFG